jgi:DNA primase
VVPIRDAEGKLVALSGRAWDDDSGPKYLHSRFKRDRELYGQHKRTESRKGYLCEGFFQVIYLWQNGYMNALGRMGTHLSKQQIAKLVEWFDHLVVVPDGDKAGRDSAKRISESLSGRIATVEVSGMPDKKDADSLEPSQLAELLGPKNSG